MLMPGDHYIDNRPGLVDFDQQGRQRYYDAQNLILANRQEIIDRAFAEVAIQYTEAAWGVEWVVPGDPVSSVLNRGFDSYRLIQLNRSEIVSTAYAAIAAAYPSFVNPSPAKCQRDIGYFVDAVSLDICLGGGNRYTRKFLKNYFNSAGTAWIDSGLQGEEIQSNVAFDAAASAMKEAITNQLTIKDLTLTIDPDTSSNIDVDSCANIQSAIDTLTAIVIEVISDGNLSNLPTETVAEIGPGQEKCKRDIGYIVDAISSDLANGGNANIIAATKSYFNKNGTPISNGLVGEESQSVISFNAARDMIKKALTNQLYTKDFTISDGPAVYGSGDPTVAQTPSGNPAVCTDVQTTVDTLTAIITSTITAGNLNNIADIQVTGTIPVFNYSKALEEWQDNSILDLSNPDNVLYKFNAAQGGAIVPRGCSLIGYDLRRTIVRPLYVPDPTDGTQGRTSIFNLTGGCYIWQFTIKDGDLSSNSPLFDEADNVGKVYFQKGNVSQLAVPEYSHHKICIMEYAESEELEKYYQKVGRAFALFQPTIDDGEFEALPQENRIVGPLSDTRSIVNIKFVGNLNPDKTTVQVTTKIAHGYFKNQYVAIIDNGLNDLLNGTFKVTGTNIGDNPKVFEYEVGVPIAQLAPLEINSEGYANSSTPALGLSARGQAEIDSVESASPYVFNCSIRSTWGLCGMWADGSKATGFKSMVVAQYTGVSLQKDDRAFIRYDEFSNTWNQASLTDAFATIPYHAKGDAYWKDDWRNFHIRASNDAFVQCVSVFAVGFHDHFLMESGGDMSITNSNSNFGNTSLHAIGFKGFSFNQDKGGYITDIIPVKEIDASAFNETQLKYYSLALQPSKDPLNDTKLYYGADNAYDPFTKPSTSISGYRLGAKTDEKIYLKLKASTGSTEIFNGSLEPSGFRRYTVALATLNPDGIAIDNLAQDAANRVEDNKAFIQQEAYGYITAKYPNLLTNTNITISKCERDIGYFVDAVVQDLRLGGNINTIQAAEGYYVGGQLAYIQNELNESIEAYDYVKNLCIAATRNFDYLIRNCSTTSGSSYVDVGDTSGLLVGMSVTQYAYNTTNFTNGRLNPGAVPVTVNPAIPSNVYIKSIVDSTTIQLGVSGSKLTSGASVNALLTLGSAYLYFDLPKTSTVLDSDNNLRGAWAVAAAIKDPSVIQDTSTWNLIDNGYPECNGVVSAIQGYFTNVNLILNQGLTPLGGRWIDASNLILENKQLIAEVAVARMLAQPQFSGFSIPGGNQKCISDVLKVIDALAFNVKYGSNNQIYEAARIYVTQPELLDGERNQSGYVYGQVTLMAIQAMRNETITVTGSSLTQVKDLTVLLDTANNPTCQNVAAAINTLMGIIGQSIGSGSTPGNLTGITKSTPTFTIVTRVEPVLDTANLATRATLFTVNTGGGTSNPHNFETGTPVRLVPRAKDGTNPDKRVIRLPKGFNTNTIYYVIAPGRNTYPENYADFSTYQDTFTTTASTKLMLATTKENAAAGIYNYSPETDSVDADVEIELQQYVLDSTYDLHQYLCNFITGQTDVIQTDVANIFDIPSSPDTVQKVFFRTFGDPNESELPQITINSVSEVVSTDRYYYVRYVSSKTFSVHLTLSEALAGTPRVTFTSGYGKNFYVFADKRVSPVKFDVNASITEQGTNIVRKGLWYINIKNESSEQYNILRRLHELGDQLKDARSKNTFYTRLKDDRTVSDRIYRLRYVIPQYAQGVRDPLNGFVIKARTDETRKLLAQRIILKKVASGSPTIPYFEVEIPNPTGGTITQQLGLPSSQLNANFDYDPYDLNQVKVINSDQTQSKVAFSVQSARQVNVSGTNLLELTVFDHTITNDALKNDKFTTLKIEAPQGGVFRFSTTSNTTANRITWNGYNNGAGYLQGFFTVDETGDNYIVVKNIDDNKSVLYNPLIDTIFTQPVLDGDGDPVVDGSGNPVLIYAKLIAKENSVGSPNNTLSKSSKKDYLYSNKDTNVLTVTPGDIIQDDDNVQYRVISVTDAGEIEDSFYIFDIDEIQRRIPNQQEGIYYLTCVKGNISPYPTGAGVGDNFRNYKFSQPISQLYPLNYKNDPLWFQIKQDGSRDESIKDTPATSCAADNFVHGLVTTNDSKNSETKEVIIDLVSNPALSRYEYVTTSIEAQKGNATSGSEDRKISICGDSPYPTEKRLFVELRRPSIARSGNHTFEYLGFGPGNYSTGFPLRQEVVLSDIQDFYAQSKKENGGIVFYTGLNSNGDLYIGNRKINAITGVETFLEQAVLTDSADESGDIGGLVTTFELPVVFEKDVTVDGDAVFNNPVTINVEASESNALTVVANLTSNAGEDTSLDSASFALSDIVSKGNIVLHKNNIYTGILTLNPRGNTLLSGQNYSIRTHADNQNGYTPTNKTPNQENSSLGFNVSFGTASPVPGDIVLRGKEVGKTGSLGWIYSNYYADFSSSVFTITALGNNAVRITLKPNVFTTDAAVNVSVGSQLRISGLTGRFLSVNGLRKVTAKTATTFDLNAAFVISTSVLDPTTITTATFEVSRNSWKETGILGGEALRTDTDNYGDFRLGINTLSRAKHGTGGDQNEAFTSSAVYPRATLDIVGTTFISGRSLTITPTNNFVNNPLLNDRTFNKVDNALLVGFDPKTNVPNNEVVLRVATTTIGTAANVGGRIGINASNAQLDRNFVLYGNARITNDVRLESNLEVNGGSITTTSQNFNLLDGFAKTITMMSVFEELAFGNATTADQLIDIGNVAATQTINIGKFSAETELNIHSNSENSLITLGTVPDNSTFSSVITVGGAYSNNSNVNSVFKVKSRYTELDGNLILGSYNLPGSGFSELQANSKNLDFLTKNTTVLNFATSVTRLSLGGAGGFTTVNNTLVVLNSTELNGDVTLIGGLNAGQFSVRRGSLGTPTTIHARGSIDLLNVDIFKKVVINKTIDTQGLGVWGGTTYRVTLNDPETYYLPLGELSTTEIGLGDYILIDRSVQVTGQNTTVSPVGEQYSEFVQVVELTNLNNVSDLPLRVKVKRARNALTVGGTMVTGPNVGSATGTYRYLRTDHPDNAVLVKYNFSDNVSYINTVGGLANPGATITQTIDTGVFSGSVAGGDILRFSDTELAFVLAVNVTSNQKFVVNDGGNPANQVFVVDSTDGTTTVQGQIYANKSINLIGSQTTNLDRLVITNSLAERFVVDSSTGNTSIYGNLGIGGSTYDRFTVDSTSNTTLRGGNLLITDNNPVSDGNGGFIYGQKLYLQNSTGNLTIGGSLTTTGTTVNTFAGDIVTNGGDLTVNKIVSNLPQKLFQVRNTGAMDFAGQEGYITPSGARKWIYVSGGTDIFDAVANINYFVSPSSDMVIKLPQNPTTGDMIRVVDVGGTLTYNIGMRFRAPTGIRVQGDATNSGQGPNPGSTHTGGELVVQTPNAALGLVYIGPQNYDGTNTNAPPSQQGWWLMEI
jgi:hypothetical protein